MAEIKAISIEQFLPFDTETNPNYAEFIEGNGYLHYSSPVISDFENNWFAHPWISLPIQLLRERGAERGEDYLITLHQVMESGKFYFSVHAKPGFIDTIEDQP